MESALALAEEAVRQADTDPGRALPGAEAAAAAARRQRDPVATALAHRAWGHALLQCGQIEEAIGHLRRSIAAANRIGSAALAGEARSKLAYALVMRGRPAAALAEIDTALTQVPDSTRARAYGQRAVILSEIGRLDEAVTAFDAALSALRTAGDRLSVARTLVNRAIVHAHRHAFADAVADLLEAETLSRAMGRELAIGIIAENLGYVETLRGDVPAALAHLDRAEQTIAANGGQVAPVHYDRGVLCLSLGLTVEARQAADLAVQAFRRERRTLKVPEARLLLAHAALIAGDRRQARAQARQAVRELDHQGRAEWSALARLAAAQAGWRIDAVQADALTRLLSQAGWPAAAVEARLVAAEVGRGDTALAHLTAASRAGRGAGPAALRARGWYAEALLRHRTGRDAVGAIRAGLRVLDDHAACLGAADLQAHVATHRRDLTDLGLRLAMRDGRPERVLEWAERSRASRLAYRPVRPPDDPELADLLAQLRDVARELAEAEGADAHLIRRQAALERRVRDHARSRRGAADTPSSIVTPGALHQALGSAALVEFVAVHRILYALVAVDGRMRVHRLGPARPIADLVRRLPFALHRMADHRGRPQSHAAAHSLLRTTAAALDDALLGPLHLAEQPLVIVPTGPLHSTAWSVLPSCVGRPIAVSPSASLWRTAASGGASNGYASVALAAGPELVGARSEARRVATLYGTTALVDGDATTAAVLSSMDGADLVHLAAHGKLAAEHPLFSYLLLADGPLYAYDLERLPIAPSTVVLAACDAGRSVVYAGDELLGLGAAFMARGTRQLIASVLPVPDAATAPLMVAMHRLLAKGVAPAEALAAAQVCVAAEGDPVTTAAAAGFVCLGSAGRATARRE
jgi:tetratricopeptide (TPR) repeat protein